MEDANPYRKAQFSYREPSSAVQRNPVNQGKSHMNFLYKALFFAILIIILPLFPSQAPDFINESVITKFWELLHLLFIGIAVSYGLFSRINVETDTERHPRIDGLQSDMSRMFHSSSLFEDGYENPYGSDERSVSQSWKGRYFLGEPGAFWSKGSTVIDEQGKPSLSFPENGVANSSTFDESNLIQAWNSQYSRGESMVVVAQPNLPVGEWGESRSGVDYKPLGLPVRSLKTRTRCESPRFVNGSESGSDTQGSSTTTVNSGNSQFGDLGPQNLEPKFHEAIPSPSPVPWRSRSRMRAMREQVSSVTRPSHFRPLSVDEAQSESTKTRSSRSRVSISSQASSISSSSPKKSTSSDSISSEESNSKMEDAGKEKISERSFSSGSPSPPKPMDDNVSSGSLHSRRYSYSSLDEKDPPPPKPMNGKVLSSALHSRVYGYCSLDEKGPSPPKPMNGKVSSSALHSRGYGYGSLDEKDPSPPKRMNDKVSSSALHTRGYSYSSLDNKDSSCPKPINNKVSSSALHSRGFSYNSLDEKDPSPPKSLNENVSSIMLHSRGCSYSSLDEKDLRGSKVRLKDLGGGRGEEMKSASFSKASPSRGKSVRTIRSRRMTDYGKTQGNQMGDQKVEKTCNNVENGNMRKENGGIDNPGNGSGRQNLDNPIPCDMLKPAFSKNGKKEKTLSVESQEDLVSRAKNVQVSSDEDAVLNTVNNEVAEYDEVDKKAGEFIAKFREQIRLQKTESMERSRGLRLGNCFR